MHAKLALFLALACPSWGALASGTLWQVQNGGVDTNGGGFVTGSSGTDRSNTAAAFCTATDFTLASGTTLATSASCPFSSASVGNILQVTTTGTGGFCTVGFYQVVSVSVVTATLDRAAGTTACVAGTFALGGALKTLSKLNTAMSTSNIQQQACVKSDSTYSIGSQVTFNFNSSGAVFPIIQGYTTTCGDGGMPTLQGTTGMAPMIVIGNNNALFNLQLENFIIDCNSQTNSNGASQTNNSVIYRNIKAENCTKNSFQDDGSHDFHGERLWATLMAASGAIGFNFTSTHDWCTDCYATDSSNNSVVGFNAVGLNCLRCIAANLTGTTTFGFATPTASAFAISGSTFDSGVCYNVTSACFNYAGTSGNSEPVTIKNMVMAKVGTYCFDSTGGTTIVSQGFFENFNFCYQGSGTGTWHLWTAGPNDVTLTADPFVNGASDNFALNNTAGGGKAVKGAGFPGTLMLGGIGFQSGGTLQPAVASPATVGFAH